MKSEGTVRRYTTPTLPITIKKKVGEDECGRPIYEDATDLVFDYLIFTMKDETHRIDKRVDFAQVQDAKFTVRFTQEETGSFDGIQARGEINFFTGETRVATAIQTINLAENLINEVIE